jgi:DNA-binding IclR family transcriptional regulator
MLRFQVRLANQMREQTGEPIRTLDTVVNLEVWLLEEKRQQQIIDSLHAPRSSARDSLARLVRAGLVARSGRGYEPGRETLQLLNDSAAELIGLVHRTCDAAEAFKRRHGR